MLVPYKISIPNGVEGRSTCGREAVKSLLQLFDELVKCDEEWILNDVRKAAEGTE